MYDLTTLNQQPAAPAMTYAASPQPGRTSVSLGNMIERIEEAIDTETNGIRQNRDFDLKASNARKSRHLYELSRAFKGLGANDILVEHKATAIHRLREKLAVNERDHSCASERRQARSPTSCRTAIQRSQEDGTYSEHVNSPTAYGRNDGTAAICCPAREERVTRRKRLKA